MLSAGAIRISGYSCPTWNAALVARRGAARLDHEPDVENNRSAARACASTAVATTIIDSVGGMLASIHLRKRMSAASDGELMMPGFCALRFALSRYLFPPRLVRPALRESLAIASPRRLKLRPISMFCELALADRLDQVAREFEQSADSRVQVRESRLPRLRSRRTGKRPGGASQPGRLEFMPLPLAPGKNSTFKFGFRSCPPKKEYLVFRQ